MAGSGIFDTPTRKLALLGILLIPTIAPAATETAPISPFETNSTINGNAIDSLVLASLKQKGIKPANLCSDEVFIRRVYLDVIGTIPTPEEVTAFLDSREPDKRAKLIDELLAREEFAEYWSLKWCDILRVKAEYPINLWPNAVQAYHRWIYQGLRDNMPYNKFAYELLTSSGSNFRVPQVNFYRAVQGREPSAIASVVALTFMGTRLEKWPEDERKQMEAFFSRIAYKGTAEWKEEIVMLDPAQTTPLKAVLPNGRKVELKVGEDPRKVFADWLTSAGNTWFSRNIANRVWAWLMGRGIIDEPDDIRRDNPPVNLKLMTYLEGELVKNKYDLRHLYRIILNSRTYQQSSIPQSSHKDAEALFAYYPVRRLEAEVLVDALCKISGTKESYSSPIPEPFTYVPEEHRSIELSDGSITSQFLEMFGRPARDTGLESERNNQPTNAQRLHMLNSTHIQNKLENGPALRTLIRSTSRNRQKLVEKLYLAILSRFPTDAEQAAALKYYQTEGVTPAQAPNDLAWALINTKEFMYRH